MCYISVYVAYTDGLQAGGRGNSWMGQAEDSILQVH